LPPPDCDENADATAPEAQGCIVDTFAVFVDGAGGTGGSDGTKAKPFKTIGEAVAKAPTQGKRRVYVCGSGLYPEHIHVTSAVSIFGGFACGSWTPDAASKPKVAPTDPGFALHVANVSKAVRFEDLAFEAVAGTESARSSIAVFVANSPNVTFRRVAMTARKGADGKDGTPGVTGTSTPSDLKGNSGEEIAGGAEKTCTCSTGGSTTGGRGGAVVGAIDGTSGFPQISPPLPDPSSNGAGQMQATCNASGLPARPGSNAPDMGPKPAPPVGTLDENGWTPGDGAAGDNGGPGQGGGGGGGRNNTATSNGGGGGGGCGGCGGGGGGGGSGGGASVALLLFSSPVKLIASTLTATGAGKGGAGKDGAPGAPGGDPGIGFNAGCVGGKGGTGGKGGAGAGGAGGVSAAVLYKGATPIHEASTLTHGKKGDFGMGGAPGTNDGPPGLEGPVVAAP
jgi:hypothetical protein